MESNRGRNKCRSSSYLACWVATAGVGFLHIYILVVENALYMAIGPDDPNLFIIKNMHTNTNTVIVKFS